MKLLILFMMMSSSLFAGILIEPFVGLNIGTKDTVTIKTGALAGSSYDNADANGDTFIGGRLGYQTWGFFGAFDYRTLMSGEDDSDASSMGLTVGYDFPILIRGWVTYLLSNDMTTAQNTEVDGDGGLRFGVGFTTLPFLSINLEYEKSEFSNSSVDTKRETLLASISLPFNL